MPWQAHVADVALEINPDTGRLAYREVVLTVPRQSGKTTLILALAVQRCLGFEGRQNVVYTAQTRADARKKWEDEHIPLLDVSPLAKTRPKPYRVRKTNGNEAIIWRDGSMHAIQANTEKSGHGGTLDLAFQDEAFAHIDARLEQAFKPAMMNRPSPQVWVVSTAGNADSVYLWGKVEAGRARCEAGTDSRVAYFEWSATDDDDPGDVDTWRRCMPALGLITPVDAVQADFDTMDPLEFERAYLNRWNQTRNMPAIAPELWAATLVPNSTPSEPLAFAFDVTPDRSSGAIGVSDGAHIEVVDHRRGTGWMVDRLVELCDTWEPVAVACDASGPAGSLLADLAARGVEVRAVTTREHQQACGSLVDSIADKRTKHRGQTELDLAVAGGQKRQVGDSWLWSRLTSDVDISPLVAVTLARWVAVAEQSPDSGEWRPLVAFT